MLTYVEVRLSSHSATVKKVEELMQQAWALGYDASTGLLCVVPVGDTVEYCQTVWTTPRRQNAPSR